MVIDSNIIPEPDDLAGWKAVDSRLSKRTQEWILSSRVVTPGIFRIFFGSKNDEYLLEEYERWSVYHSFAEWVIYDYHPVHFQTPKKKKKLKDKNRLRLRKPRKGKALFEKMLASADLPLAETMLLEASSQAYPTMFKIIDVEFGSTLTVEDLILGGEHLIHDRALSECVQVNHCMAGRLIPIGKFNFFSPAGPPLSPFLVFDAISYMESQGVTLSKEGLRRDASKFGLLWNWLDKRAGEPAMPHLKNTDGHELILQTASFSYADEKVLRETLSDREDIDYDEENDVYHWNRAQEQGQGMVLPGGKLSLGRIEIVLDELILHVNSTERLDRAAQWLEKIPGVEFLDVKSQDINEEGFDTPMDDQMGSEKPMEMTPEIAESVQSQFHEYYMNWLDRSLPMLEGKTPRQTCKSKAGQQKIATLIRTIPSPTSDQDLEIIIPRQKMLKELGLESV